ncbi:hypothetical protein [Paenibacillus sp. UASWS1643]|uniref:hypothetical protein n=1 Tax=Paenibacillus sp. UASWS1643 TaxID=2580422 RepID=UPI0012395613|nr:hypothetical protein [Paenibacillus sp. UASWS1643]KAA8750099.1 hypothetical protein FE296_16000 [Paenibacillus sp. UASWS1643]
MATPDEKEVKVTKPATKTASPPVETFATGKETWTWLGPQISSIKLRPGNMTSGFPERARPLYDKLYQVRALLLPLTGSLSASIAMNYEPDSFEAGCYKDLQDMIKRGEI